MVAVVTAERQGNLHGAQPRDSGREGKAMLLRQSAPLPLFLLVHQAREDVDPPLLPPLGAKVTQHDTAEEHSIERHDYQNIEVRVPVALPGGLGLSRILSARGEAL